MNQTSIALLLAATLTGCSLDTDVKKVGEDNVGGGSGDDTGSLNDPPTVSVTLNPAEAYTNTVLTADAIADDPDSATVSLSYVFQVNEATVQEGDINTLDGAVHFNKGQTVRVIATATDGAASSEASSEPVLILNSLPSAPAVSVTEDPGLFCSIDDESNDEDGDPIAYTFTWAVDGEPYTGATVTTTHDGDSILEDNISGMAEWTCTVTPNDGEADGPPGEATVRVGDYDGDGVANDEDCAPADPDIPRMVLWASIETVTMESSPPSEGSTWCDGAWGDQGVRSAYDRIAWVQESDWNSLWVPDPISDDEETYAVDVDLYLPSGNRGGEFGINRTMPGACNHSSGGLVLNYSDGRCGDAGPCLNIGGVGGPYYNTSARDDIFNRWVNMRFEVFRSDGLVQLWIDDELETCFFADDEALYGPQVKFNANSSCCSEAPNLGISNLNFSLAE